jgi:glycosyltransferase involved in cell wall biosynthesis
MPKEISKRKPFNSWAVHFTGQQDIKWALDEDLRWARRVLDGDLRLTSARQSRIVHAAWWPSAWLLGTDVLRSQKVVCFSDNAPSFYARQPEFHAVRPFVDKWIARSRQAVREFLSFGIDAELAPYCVDPKIFFRLPPGDADLQALRQQLGLPADAYVIGNFHSDTAFTLGPDRPKWQKGPDVFAEIVRQVREAEPRVCVLLAGPRRHWLRRRLKACGVPVYFLGRELEGDDFGKNIVDRSKLNCLYNLLDLCLVSSRWEGGPHSILEACFAKTKVLSTRVGISEDVLEEASLFDTIPEAASRISDDIRCRKLDATREPQYRRVLAQNTPERLAEALRRIYKCFPQEPPKKLAEAACAWLRTQTRAHLHRQSQPPTILGLLAGNAPGKLFRFLQETLRQARAFVLRETIAGDCRHYLADASWLSSNDTKRLADRTVVVVDDNWTTDDSLPVPAIIVPSFESLNSSRQENVGPLSLVIPPALDGKCFDPEIPVREQLTSTAAGVVQAIRQLFLVLDAPEDVRWLGFR